MSIWYINFYVVDHLSWINNHTLIINVGHAQKIELNINFQNSLPHMQDAFTKHHYKIFKFLSQNDLSRALEYICKLEIQGELDQVLTILKTYILVEMQDYTEAEKLVSNVKNGKLNYFLKVIYKALNRISEYKNVLSNSIIEHYEASVLSGDFPSCKNAGIKMLAKNPIYFVFALILSYESTKSSEDLRLLKLTIEKYPPTVNVCTLLVKRNILVDHVIYAVQRNKVNSLPYLYLLKEIFINYQEYQESVINLVRDIEPQCDAARIFSFFAEKFDDWQIYEKALNDNVQMEERKVLNYVLYKIKRDGDKTLALKTCTSYSSFKIIFKIFELVDIYEELPENLKILFNIRIGATEENVKRMYEIYTEEMSLVNTNILLACLISTKKENNLLLALYIARTMYEKFNTYEIKLVYLFMCRFFCILPEVIRVMDALEIKSIQNENLAFIWNDLCILLGKRHNKNVEKYINTHRNEIRKINEYTLQFVDAGKLDHAFDLVHLRRKLLDSIIYSEICEQTIMSRCVKNMFSDLLTPPCSYIFDKLTVNHGGNQIKIGNIFQNPDSLRNIGEFLDNGMYNIEPCSEFAKWLKSNGFNL
eukprot:jgi/Antlo1/353/498